MAKRWWWVAVLGAVVVAPVDSDAAVLLKLDVVADGSAAPPGDRIDVRVLLLPGDEGMSLETRAFVKLQDHDDIVPVEARGADHRDSRGRVLVSAGLEPIRDSREADGHVVVPFAALKLPAGRHEIAYEVRGVKDGQVVFAHATPMTMVVVSDRTRTTMRPRQAAGAPRVATEQRTAYVAEGGKAVARPVEIEIEQVQPGRPLGSVKVEIVGEFVRPAAVRLRSGTAAGTGSVEQELAPLEGKPWAALSDFEAKAKRTVYYATNRSVTAAAEHSPARFGIEVAPSLTFGSCLINIPVEHHARGELEVPSWWQSRDPKRFFLVEALDVLPRDLFGKALAADDVLLFVHGYNTTFEFAVLRAGQLVHDLRFPGKAAAFSWPSAGGVSRYPHDEQVNAESVPALVEVLRMLTAPQPLPRKVHVIVHSMGNRLFLQAARQLELERAGSAAPKGKLFGHVALAAPDVDATTFAALLPSVIRRSETTTLYYCQSDRALLASRAVHVDKPVGLGPFFAEGLDTINADRANTSFLGHGYFASEGALLADLMLTILRHEKPDERRPPLGRRTFVLGYPHWALVGLGP